MHPVCFSDDCFDRFLPRCPCPVTKREHVITRLARRWSLVVSVHTYSNPVLGVSRRFLIICLFSQGERGKPGSGAAGERRWRETGEETRGRGRGGGREGGETRGEGGDAAGGEGRRGGRRWRGGGGGAGEGGGG